MKRGTFYIMLYFSLLLFFQNSFGQNLPKIRQQTLRGIVISEKNKMPLQYVNIGILKRDIGTLSNKDGYFSISLDNFFSSDTLLVSCIGYEPLYMQYKDVVNNKDTLVFELKENYLALENVVVSASKEKKIVGRSKTGGIIQATFNPKSKKLEDNLGTEMGIKISASKKTYHIQNFNFYLSRNNFNALKFRINVYSLNEKGLPEKNLLTENVYYDVKAGSTGWQSISLEKHRLYCKAPTLISLEWISSDPSSNNKNGLIIPGSLSKSHPTYIRKASQGDWTINNNFSISFYAIILE